MKQILLKDVSDAAWKLSAMCTDFKFDTIYHATCLTYNRYLEYGITLDRAAGDVLTIFAAIPSERRINVSNITERTNLYRGFEARIAFSLLGLYFGEAENYVPGANYAIHLDKFDLGDGVVYEWADVVFIRIPKDDLRNTVLQMVANK